jgi:iron complex outermembrane receptor protein
LRYLLGGFYYRETNRIPFYYIYQQANVNLVQYRQDDENAAAFGRLTYAVTPSIRLTAGARYTSEVKRLDGTLAGNIRACVLASCPGADPLSFSLALDPPNFDPAPAPARLPCRCSSTTAAPAAVARILTAPRSGSAPTGM